jgi:hypothetical protein
VLEKWTSVLGKRKDAAGVLSGSDFLHRCLETKRKEPQFYMIYTGAAHSSMLDVRTHPEVFDRFEREDYPFMRRNADKELVAMLEDIFRYDRGALVILIGDHSAWRYRGIEKGGGNINVLTRSRGKEPSLIARDRVGVLLAIKWPESLQQWVQRFLAGRVISHVNLFRFIFAALTENLSLLDDCEPNESYIPANGKLYKVAKDGVLLQDWEEFTSPVK